MKIAIKRPWGVTSHYVSMDDLVRAYAETRMENFVVEYMDGCRAKEDVPGEEDFVERTYSEIVNGDSCEIEIDGGYIDFVFPESIRFETAAKLKGIIKDCHQKVS